MSTELLVAIIAALGGATATELARRLLTSSDKKLEDRATLTKQQQAQIKALWRRVDELTEDRDRAHRLVVEQTQLLAAERQRSSHLEVKNRELEHVWRVGNRGIVAPPPIPPEDA